MAKCPFGCEKEQPGKELPSCSSCFFKAIPDPEPVVPSKGLDLSYMKDEKSDTIDIRRKPVPAGLAVFQIEQWAKTAGPVRKGTLPEMKKLKVKSNNFRNKTFSEMGLNMQFNSEGVAEIQESELASLKELMKHRPGRFSIIDEEIHPSQPIQTVDQLEQARSALFHDEVWKDMFEDEVDVLPPEEVEMEEWEPEGPPDLIFNNPRKKPRPAGRPKGTPNKKKKG